ncbi:MAG TPA: translation initiation factor IF-2 [Acidimicrobiales bacterium]|nr:translation initiation factor IF-2 [Acidimicrobiales bacterium]
MSGTGKPIPPPPGTRPPMSSSGKPIPPPPGRGPRPPLSSTGRPIPPPPGGRPSSAPTPRPGGPRPGGGFGAPRPSGGFGGRPGGGAGGPRPGGFGGRPGGPGRPGGGGGGFGTRGGPGGPGGRGARPPQRRRTGRRRRTFEELEAQELTRYTPSHAPIPEGEVIIERGSTAKDIGPKLNRSAADVVRFLLQQGEMVTATMSLSDDMIELFAAEIGASIRLVDPGEEQEAELQLKYFEDEEDDPADLRPRPPVVTVMGHVDHGKTLLLDRIRHTHVVEGEAGGITQHIGAYQVDLDGRLITFIDTPGHAAFSAMRARGANVTDIVVLVVAADDGVMPQTVEAINHAKAADVPIVVAINKIDREDADPNRVKQELSAQGLVPEDWGGDTIMVEVSALQDLGIDDLLEQLLVVAEVEELTANPKGRARGFVLEANLDVGQGPVATVLVDKGTLRVGDPVVAGAAWGKVRALIDDRGDRIKEAFPSQPVQVLGLSAVPQAGDVFRVAPDEKTARTIGEARAQRYRLGGLGKAPSVPGAGAKLEDIFEQIQRGEMATLNLVLKADVHGSLEAVTESLRKLERDEVKLSFVHRAVGGISEYDVNLAAASNATIIGFNVRPDRRTRELAETLDVEIRTYEIIYKLIEDIEAAMVGMLAPEYEEVVTGDAEVREIFSIPNVGRIAGCYVLNGTITRGSKVRFLREGTIIWKGTIRSLRRFKDDVREVQAGFECGIGLSDFQDLKPGDVIETFDEREIPRT